MAMSRTSEAKLMIPLGSEIVGGNIPFLRAVTLRYDW